MGSVKTRPGLRLALAILLGTWALPSLAFEPFRIGEIRSEGLERLDEGTILTYLPLSSGDEVNRQTARQSLRALYGSGLFEDVRLERDGRDLVIYVRERPAISSFTIEGNDKVSGDELDQSLSDLGLTEGELFKRELLAGVEQELQRQYFANGFYDVEITTQVNPLPNNRVDLKIDVVEGKVTKIKDINVVGNSVFSSQELLDAFELSPSIGWRLFQSSDRYSKQKLSGDLESLTSYYQDRGYLKFGVTSVQVQLSPDKEDIYLTINIEEGEVYQIKENRFSGETILPPKAFLPFVTTRPGDTFSRKQATESANRIEELLSNVGYAFAEVEPLPEVEEDGKLVGINYYVEPGKRAYVRRINFTGHGGTHDETLRREMRQLEAAPFSKSSVERSRVRLARLPFVEDATVETVPVPGTEDLVDVNFSIKQRAPGSVQFGVGFSGSQGFLLTGSLTHTNFFGTGNRIALELSNNSFTRAISASWTDPYFTNDGISQTVSAFFRESDSVVRFSSGFNFNTIGSSLTYGIPLSEYTRLRAGFGIEQTALDTFANASSDQVLEFVINNGSSFDAVEFRTGIARDTRNRTFFASRGALHSLNVDITVPGSDLEYYSATYRMQQYIPLPFKFFVEFNGNVGMVDDYGSGQRSTVPPYENLFAGGARTVRGYRDGSLGPRDTPFNNSFGGRLRTTAQIELVIPTPFASSNRSTRLSAFYDGGQVFARPADFDSSELRYSAGIAFQWFTPFLGLLDLSYAFPLNDEIGDRTDRFQINFGTGF
ncbi:MAG: outer membrane protein assembly factor BamA [Panacagrimonas sp.]